MGIANFVSLTGEGEPQLKIAGSSDHKDMEKAIFDAQNVLFSGTSVISGSGLAIVFSTGSGKVPITLMYCCMLTQLARGIHIYNHEKAQQPAPIELFPKRCSKDLFISGCILGFVFRYRK